MQVRLDVLFFRHHVRLEFSHRLRAPLDYARGLEGIIARKLLLMHLISCYYDDIQYDRLDDA